MCLLAVRLHMPDFFMAVVAADKDNLRAVGRNRAAFGGVHEFAGRATENRNAPEAGLLRGRGTACRQHMAAVGKPTNEKGLPLTGYGDRVSLSSAHRAEKDSRSVRESEVLAIGRKGCDRDRVVLRI